MKAPCEFVLLVLMVIWTEDLYDLTEEYQWLEFFAGNAACTTFARLKGFRGCKFDLKYHVENQMRTRKTNYMDVNSDSGFILCIIFLLKGRVNDFVSWWGIKCSSWTQVNVGTSARAACASLGDLLKASVLEANKMLERICLLLMLTSCLDGAWVLEQPNGSLLEFYPTFRWVITRLIEASGIQLVARISWWMSAFGSETAKPQYAYLNSPAIRKLHHFGNSSSKVKKNHLKIETCRQYQNKEGKACYTGTRQLKATEIYPDPFGEAVANPIDDLKLHKFGIPNLPNPLPDPVESFKNTESMKGSGLFDYAGLESVYKYLRKGTNLHIPKEWEGLGPNSI